MAVPTYKKFLMPAVVAAGALLIAAAPPSAVAPDLPVPVAACTPPEAAAPVAPEGAEPDVAQQALIDHVSRRFLVAAAITERMVATAYRAAAEVGLDPLLVLAVIAVESRFNPIAESGMGAKEIGRASCRERVQSSGGRGGATQKGRGGSV